MDAWKSIIEVVTQLHSTLPDSVLFGSIILYVLTLNTCFFVFALFILEIIGTHKLISWMFKESSGMSGSTRTAETAQCYAGYKLPRQNVNRIFSNHEYPSYGVFSFTAITTYLGLSTYKFSATMKSMGPQWEGRSAIAFLFITGLLLAFIMVRLVICDSLNEILVSVVCAVLSALLFFYINTLFFGLESVNFLGLPMLESKVEMNKNIYICNASNDQ